MAIKHFLGGRLVLGTEFAGYKIGIFEAGTSTPKTTYKDSALTVGNENTDPVVLDANGAAQIWFDGNAKAIFYTSADVVVYTDDNINLSTSDTATGSSNLVLNESFEDDTDADGIPDNWTQTLYTGGSFSVDSTTQFNGAKSVKFTSAGTGGGYITSTANFTVSPSITYSVGFALKSTDAGVRNVVEILWYQDDGTASAVTATSTIYDDSTTNPTSWTEKWYEITSPTDAAYAKVRLTGCHSSDVTSGSTWFDSVIFSRYVIKQAMNTFDLGLGPDYMQNVGMTEAVSTNALTITLTGKDGNAPSSTNIVSAAFRSTIGTNATYNVRKVSSSKTITVPATASLGFSASEVGYIYRYLLDDGTNIQLGVAKRHLFDESRLHAVTAISASATDANVLYGGTANGTSAVRMIGRGQITASGTAGNWSVVSSRIDPWMPGMKKTGDIVQTIRATTTAVTTSASVIAKDDSIPQLSEGETFLTGTIVGTSEANKFEVFSNLLLSTSAGSSLILALFRSGANALKAYAHNVGANNIMNFAQMDYVESVPTSTATTTYVIRGGPVSAGAVTMNGESSARILGGAASSFIEIIERQE
jgi:hypothetical protein